MPKMKRNDIKLEAKFDLVEMKLLRKVSELFVKYLKENENALEQKQGFEKTLLQKELALKAYNDGVSFLYKEDAKSKAQLKRLLSVRKNTRADALKQIMKHAAENSKPNQQAAEAHQQSFMETLENTRRYAIEKAALDISLEILATLLGPTHALDFISGFAKAISDIDVIADIDPETGKKRNVLDDPIFTPGRVFTPMFNLVTSGLTNSMSNVYQRQEKLMRDISNYKGSSAIDNNMVGANLSAAQQAQAQQAQQAQAQQALARPQPIRA